MAAIRQFVVFIRRFGLLNGIVLFIKFTTNRVDSLKLPMLRFPLSLRSNTSDMAIFRQVFLHKEYNLPFANKPKVVIDGGANIGLFALKMKNDFPDATIICVEPDVDNYKVLKKNVMVYDKVFCENCGIWNKDVKLTVHDKFELGKWAMVVEEDNEKGTIPAITIGSLMKKYSIDYIDVLKLDIETSEKAVFFDNYEEWLPRTKMIIIELHDFMLEGCAKPFFEAINRSFTKYNYSTFGENTVIINRDLN